MKYMYNGIPVYPDVEVYPDAIAYLGGITMKEFYLCKERCAAAWSRAREKLGEHFGSLLPLPEISGPPISYGHVICLGASAEYPEDGEPNVKPIYTSIDEGIESLKKSDNRFDEHPLFHHYYELCSYLGQQFPLEKILFSGMGPQGILTTAILLRGNDFIYDLYDFPEKVKLFLELLTDSIVEFHYFINRVNNLPKVDPESHTLFDDLASLLSPSMWTEFVIPYWNRFYAKITTGKRYLHCENLAPNHIGYLKDACISHYQPSVSDQLTIEKIRANTDIPFDWLLYSYRIIDMDDAQIREWVDDTLKKGITHIRTQFGRFTCQKNKLGRILAFYDAFGRYMA